MFYMVLNKPPTSKESSRFFVIIIMVFSYLLNNFPRDLKSNILQNWEKLLEVDVEYRLGVILDLT